MKHKYKSIKEFFEINLSHVKFDIKLLNQLKTFRLQWSTKSDEYIEFLGTNLLGVYEIRFSKIDDENLMSIYGIDNIDEFQKEFYLTNGINPNFKVASNVIYHTLAYTMHRYITSSVLSDKYKKEGVREACLIMQYKMMSSIYFQYFKYKVNKATALKVYEKLSYKYLNKKLGSWQNVLEYRVEECLNPKSTNYKKLVNYTNEDAVNLITDIQTKIRSMILSVYKVLVETVEEKSTIMSEDSTFIGGEKNEKQVKDVVNQGHYITYVKNIIYKPNELIDKNLITVVDKLFSNISSDDIYKFLKCISDEKRIKPNKLFPILEKLITVNLEYLQRQNLNVNKRENIPTIIVKIKYYWSSSKVKNSDMDTVKDFLKKKVRECSGRSSNWYTSAVANAFVVYITLRMFKEL